MEGSEVLADHLPVGRAHHAGCSHGDRHALLEPLKINRILHEARLTCGMRFGHADAQLFSELLNHRPGDSAHGKIHAPELILSQSEQQVTLIHASVSRLRKPHLATRYVFQKLGVVPGCNGRAAEFVGFFHQKRNSNSLITPKARIRSSQ